MITFVISRRTVRLLWLAACLFFALGLLHRLDAYSASGWVYRNVHGGASQQLGGRLESLAQFTARSESLWAKTVKQRHEMIEKDYGHASRMPAFPATNPKIYQHHPYTIWDFVPASYNCPYDVERIGRMGDGGKWVCGMSQYVNYPKGRDCVVYSFGVRDESSFGEMSKPETADRRGIDDATEEEMLERTKCTIWAYDFSVVDFGEQLRPAYRDRAHFKQVGIAGKTNESQTPPFYSISDLMAMNGHDYIDILKMDIEYAEFEALDAMHVDFPISGELPIGQLLVEVHLWAGNGMTSKKFLDWWERLEARGLRPTWTEPNLLAVTLNVEKKNPMMAEYTMINSHDSRNILFRGR